MLLNSSIKQETKKSNKEKSNKNEDTTPISSYQKNKKKHQVVDKKIELILEKEKKEKEDKKKREEEERKKKLEDEERRRQFEREERIRREREEKIRKEEEEKKRKEEEELKKRLEIEEKKRKEEEEKKRIEEEKRQKEEEKRRKEEEEKRKEEEEKRKEEEEKNKIIEKKYFIVFKNKKPEKKEFKYTFEYIMQFKKWKIANEDELLTEKAKEHFEEFKEEERDSGKPKRRDNGKPYYKPKQSQKNTKEELNNSAAPTLENSMEQWARKDMTKEIKAAEEFKHKLEETIKDDPIKRNLRNYLNMLTKDNYDKIRGHIFEIIKEKVEYQVKFLDVLFQKAVSERAFVKLYAKLCKDLDRDLPQKNPPKESKNGEKSKKQTSVMRAKLLDKCREIFQIKNNEKFDEYIKEKDPEERENKLKNFVLGNVYFITELISIKILSKKIAPVCIKNLFERYESVKGDVKLKLINIQAIVIFTDQFGSLVHSQEKKINTEEAKQFKDNIDNIFQKLEKVKDEEGLPGHIKYSIINLIEKRKKNYQKSKVEKYREAKSKKEVEQELETHEQITQDDINDKIKKGLSDYREFVEEEGSSEKYPWKETTFLYDKKEKSLDEILEGYIISCSDFIEKESNIKYAKEYIKELIEYYGTKIHKKEKKDLRNKLLKLFELVRDYALETPQIYDIYAYIIVIFLDNKIMEISDLKDIINEKDVIDDDYKTISSVFEMTYKYYKEEDFKEEIAQFDFIKNHSHMFKWLYEKDEENTEEKEKKDE